MGNFRLAAHELLGSISSDFRGPGGLDVFNNVGRREGVGGSGHLPLVPYPRLGHARLHCNDRGMHRIHRPSVGSIVALVPRCTSRTDYSNCFTATT